MSTPNPNWSLYCPASSLGTGIPAPHNFAFAQELPGGIVFIFCSACGESRGVAVDTPAPPAPTFPAASPPPGATPVTPVSPLGRLSSMP